MVDINGNEVATFDYTPFGSVRTSSGTYANTNPFRCSSEYHDDETDLVYYNFRYYNPDIGRWINRDPIGEKGGFNLYVFVQNDTTNKYDYLGLSSQSWGIINWRTRIRQIIRAFTKGDQSPDFNNVFQRLMEEQLRVDPKSDFYGDCQDDMEDIFSALYGEIAAAHHGDNVQELFPRRDDGSNLTHFLVGTSYEMSLGVGNLGDIAQWLYESVGSFAGDWQRDTAVAYLGSYFADKFDTSDCKCKKLVKAFADGRIKFTDMFFMNPRTFLPDQSTTKRRNAFVAVGKEHIDNIVNPILDSQ
jgi:RHS repeat-associated protein